MSKVLSLAIPVPLQRTFDYLPGRAQQAVVGARYRVPFAGRELVGICVEAGDPAEPERKLKSTLEQCDQEPLLSPHLLALCQWASQYYVHPLGEVIDNALPALLRKGEPAASREQSTWALTDKGRWLDPGQLGRAPRQQEALVVLQKHGTPMVAPLLAGMGVNTATLMALEKKGLAARASASKHPLNPERVLAAAPLALRDEQQAALSAITENTGFQAWLLNGRTGSGKTEVYLQAIAHCLREDRQVLVLVPEISLTPQTLKRFRQRFAVPVVEYHSGLTDRQRLDHWMQALHGNARIIIGTRSAAFCPLARPGMIIVDEEHDASFKQQDGFRYHARDLAIKRAHMLGIPVVLGSATPSLESLHNVHSGRFQELRLNAHSGPGDIRTRLLDMRREAQEGGLAHSSIDAIRDALQAGQQVMVFLNRRGYSPVLLCHHCGWQAHCPHCESRLTLHLQQRHLRCHHCDYRQGIPAHCKHCNSTDLRPIGSGTERLQDVLREQFPDTPIFRVDRDTVSSHIKMQQTMEAIHHKEKAILIGTQMLAKGHHFPRLGLVVLVNVDAGWLSADLKAAEKTAQLITQVSGRSGRGLFHGQVILQTWVPDNPLLQTLLREGYGAFAERQLAERALLQFPPYGFFCLVRCESQHAGSALDILTRLRRQLDSHDKVQMLGPVASPMARRAGYHRAQLLLRSTWRSQLNACAKSARHWLEEDPDSRRARWSLDIDPADLF